MQRLALDYVKSGVMPSKTGAALLLLGIAAALLMAFQFKTAEQELAATEDKTGHLAQQLKRSSGETSASPATPELLQEARLANAILTQLALPWDALFKALESSQSDDIALLSIQPNTDKHSVKVSGEAKDFSAMLAYIQQLEQDKTMTEVVLMNHEVNLQTPEKPVRFALSANWSIQP